MFHSLPHLTLTTSTCSLSSASPIFPTTSPTHARPSVHDPYIYPAMFHDRVVDQHKSHLSHEKYPGVPVPRARRRRWFAVKLCLKDWNGAIVAAETEPETEVLGALLAAVPSTLCLPLFRCICFFTPFLMSEWCEVTRRQRRYAKKSQEWRAQSGLRAPEHSQRTSYSASHTAEH